MNWIKLLTELLPYVVAMASIVTIMVMLDVLAQVFRNQ